MRKSLLFISVIVAVTAVIGVSVASAVDQTDRAAGNYSGKDSSGDALSFTYDKAKHEVTHFKWNGEGLKEGSVTVDRDGLFIGSTNTENVYRLRARWTENNKVAGTLTHISRDKNGHDVRHFTALHHS